jgi:hypothetical protein
MILLGCLLAFGASVAPRLFLLLAWLFSARWPLVWRGDFILPLLGIIFLPYTTIMYMLVWTPGGIDGWDYMWVILGLFLDLWKWAQVWANREKGREIAQTYYSSGAPRTPTASGGTSVGGSTTGSTTGTGTTGTGSTGTGTSASGSSGGEPPA